MHVFLVSRKVREIVKTPELCWVQEMAFSCSIFIIEPSPTIFILGISDNSQVGKKLICPPAVLSGAVLLTGPLVLRTVMARRELGGFSGTYVPLMFCVWCEAHSLHGKTSRNVCLQPYTVLCKV